MPKFTCNLIIKETPTQVYFCEYSKFSKKAILQNTCKWLVLDFEQFYGSLHNSVQQAEQQERKLSSIYSTGFQHRRTIAKRNNEIRKCNFSSYLLQKSSTWNHSLGRGSRLEMNEWMKIFNLLWIRYKRTTCKSKDISWTNLLKFMILMIQKIWEFWLFTSKYTHGYWVNRNAIFSCVFHFLLL